MNTLTNDSLMSQDPVNRDFSARGHREKVRNPIHSIQGETQEKIVYVLSIFPQHKFLVLDLATAIDSHRSTIGHHCLQLFENHVVCREILAGTENKVRPTHVYFLNPEIKNNIQEFLLSRLETNPAIKKINEEFLTDKAEELTIVVEEGDEQKLPFPERENLAPITEGEGKSSFHQLNTEQNISLVINTMASEIANLKQRIAYLEQKIEDRDNQINLSPAIEILGIEE